MDESPNKLPECATETNQTGIHKIKSAPEESFFDKNKAIKIAVMLTIIIFSCAYIRLYEASMPALDKAANLDITYLTIEKVKEKMYNPLADPKELQKEMETTIKQIYQSKDFKEAVNQRVESYKSLYRDANGRNYPTNADTYYFLKEARDLKENKAYPATLFPYIIAYSSKILRADIMQVANYLPLIFAVLTCITVFFLASSLSNYWGGFFAAFLLAIHPVFLDATAIGYADTQILNIFFSALLALFFVMLLKTSRCRARLLYLALLLIVFILFRWTWANYFYMLVPISITLFGYLLLKQIISKSKPNLIMAAVELILAGVSVFFMLRLPKMQTVLDKILGSDPSHYPDALAYIQELQYLPISNFVRIIDPFILSIAIVSAAYLICSLVKKRNILLFFLITWFITLIAISPSAARLAHFFILPLTVIIGVGISILFSNLLTFPKNVHLNIPKYIFEPILAIIILLLLFSALKSELFQYLPDEKANTGMVYTMSHRLVDDSIEKIAKTILTKTKTDAIINDWWDLGYIYQYYTRRPAIADGGSFNSPNVYWFAKALMSANETESADILHMIDCGTGYYSKELIKVNCSVTEGIVIVSDYAIKRHPVILKTAEWDFKLAEIYPEIKELSTEEALERIKQKYPDYASEEIYGHMTQYTDALPESKIKLAVTECTRKENSIVCGDYSYDISLNKLYSGITEYSFAYINDTHIIRKNIGTDKTIIIYMENRRIRYAIVNSDFMDSLLVKLYFFEAKEMKYFELLDKASFPYAKKIKAFRVRWA